MLGTAPNGVYFVDNGVENYPVYFMAPRHLRVCVCDPLQQVLLPPARSVRSSRGERLSMVVGPVMLFQHGLCSRGGGGL
jgi:hypothetical protein